MAKYWAIFFQTLFLTPKIPDSAGRLWVAHLSNMKHSFYRYFLMECSIFGPFVKYGTTPFKLFISFTKNTGKNTPCGPLFKYGTILFEIKCFKMEWSIFGQTVKYGTTLIRIKRSKIFVPSFGHFLNIEQFFKNIFCASKVPDKCSSSSMSPYFQMWNKL